MFKSYSPSIHTKPFGPASPRFCIKESINSTSFYSNTLFNSIPSSNFPTETIKTYLPTPQNPLEERNLALFNAIKSVDSDTTWKLIEENSHANNPAQGYKTIQELAQDIKLSKEQITRIVKDAFANIEKIELGILKCDENNSITIFKTAINTQKMEKQVYSTGLERTYSLTRNWDGTYEIFIFGSPLKNKKEFVGTYKNVKTDALQILYNKNDKEHKSSLKFERYVTANSVNKDYWTKKKRRTQDKYELNSGTQFTKEITADGFIRHKKSQFHFVYKAPWLGNPLKSKMMDSINIINQNELFINLLEIMDENNKKNGIIYYDLKSSNMLITKDKREIRLIDYMNPVFSYINKKSRHAYFESFDNNAHFKLSLFCMVLAHIEVQYNIIRMSFTYSDSNEKIKCDFHQVLTFLQERDLEMAKIFHAVFHENEEEPEECEEKLPSVKLEPKLTNYGELKEALIKRNNLLKAKLQKVQDETKMTIETILNNPALDQNAQIERLISVDSAGNSVLVNAKNLMNKLFHEKNKISAEILRVKITVLVECLLNSKNLDERIRAQINHDIIG